MVWNRSPSDPPQPSEPAAEPRSQIAGRVASLGPSITIKGNLSGEEDLVVDGRVEGEISLKQHNVTIGPSGRVKADIYSKSIWVEGEVAGNLYGAEEVIIRKSGRVEGNATAPRVTLENGAKFRGSIDMQPQAPGAADGSAAGGERRGTGPAAPGKRGALGRLAGKQADAAAAAPPART